MNEENTQNAYTLKDDIIESWKKNLLDDSFGIKFNCDYAFIVNDAGVLEGDASLYLAYALADISDDNQLYSWYEEQSKRIPAGGYHISDYIVTMFTGIPIEDACKLMWPTVLMADDYPIDNITPAQFIAVLDVYLETGVVDWNLIYET